MSSTTMSFRRRRVFKLAIASLVVSLCFLTMISSSDTQEAVNAVLDELVQQYAAQAPKQTPSTRVQDMFPDLRKSPRDFRTKEYFVSAACSLLSTRRVLFVGPQTTYFLHSLWLAALNSHDDTTHFCPGIEFCNFHHICLPFGYASSRTRYKYPPHDEELFATDSALLRYVLSTSLSTIKSKNDSSYTKAVIDPTTGVRLKNSYWLQYAQQSDVMILNRGPIPAPAWTYGGDSPQGNWTFLEEIEPHLRPTHSSIANAALHITKTNFLPDVLHSLARIPRNSENRTQTLIWHASWYHGFVSEPFAGVAKDPWAAYYNLQVYMQNYLLARLLPLHGIYFLQLQSSYQPDNRAVAGPKDGLRYPAESSGAEEITVSFLRSMVALLDEV